MATAPMTVDMQAILAHCPELPADQVAALWRRIDDEYRHRFDAATIAAHFRGLSRLSATQPIQTLIEPAEAGGVACTVLAFDHPFEFSLLTGALAGTGLSIEAGDVFTLPPLQSASPPRPPASRSRPSLRRPRGFKRWAVLAGADPAQRGLIVDHFVGQLTNEGDTLDAWRERFEPAVREVIALLETRDASSVQRANQRVNELVTQRLMAMQTPPEKMLLPVDLDLTPRGRGQARVTIVGQDTPAFLYTLSTAFSLRGLDIRRVRIRNAQGGSVRDEIDVVDPAVRDDLPAETLQRVRLAVLLTKQFTYFLGQAPDPFTALQRFGQLIAELLEQPGPDEQAMAEQWLTLLADPRAMQALARLLGMSDYLWEGFIRGQYRSVLAVIEPYLRGRRFCEPVETLPRRIEQALDGAVGLAEQRDRLNRFKNHETFLIDVEHILTPGVDFRELSQRLTALAECLVAAAAQLVYEDLVRSHGRPRFEALHTEFVTPDTFAQPLPYAVFGLGKLGGVALGYASDIELLFVYPGTGKTTGGKRKRISNEEFYEMLVRETAQFLKTRREGIFEIDLRLRPYGNDGPMAVSLDQFCRYYDPTTTPTGTEPRDPAANGRRPLCFERLALVRLRWIAGDPALGFEIERLRDRFVYDHPDFDLDALWLLWGKQKRQKLAGHKQPNAKYSAGTLVDLEGAVQMLQVRHAGRVPQLRTARLSQAMEALRRASVLNPADYAALSAAYHFYRRLINALRIVRGDARDLFLPDADADEFTHLARRMGYVHEGGASEGTVVGPAVQLARDIDHHRDCVRRFIREQFGRPCPGE